MEAWPEPGEKLFGFPTGMAVEVRCPEHSVGAPGRKGASAALAAVITAAGTGTAVGAGTTETVKGTSCKEQSELRSKYRLKVRTV